MHAGDLKENIVKALSKDFLLLVKMLHVGCDGPNVNRSLKRQLNDSVVDHAGKLLIDIGSCNIHILHNGFHAGLVGVDHSWTIDEFLSDVFAFFKKYPTCSEGMSNVHESLLSEKKVFKWFVSNRWPSLGPFVAMS